MAWARFAGWIVGLFPMQDRDTAVNSRREVGTGGGSTGGLWCKAHFDSCRDGNTTTPRFYSSASFSPLSDSLPENGVFARSLSTFVVISLHFFAESRADTAEPFVYKSQGRIPDSSSP